VGAGLATSDAVVPDLLAHPTRRFPEKVCVALEDRALTYAQVSDRASRFAGYLLGRGIGRGRRIALLALNELEFVEIRVGAQRAGVILVALNYRLAAPELASILEDCEPDLLVVGAGFEQMAASLPAPALLSIPGAEGMPSYESAIARAEPLAVPVGLSAQDIAIIGYTSGTTGRPKGVMKSNHATWSELCSQVQEFRPHANAVYVACMPMFHISANVGLAVVAVGGTHLQSAKFDVDEFLRFVDASGVTHAQLVPAMIQAVLERWGERPASLQSVEYGGSPMAAEVARRAARTWQCDLLHVFGLTEAMAITMLAPHEHDPDGAPELLGSVGRSAAFMTWRIVDADDRELPVGEVGEVIARGPNVMSGYWRNPQATEETLRGGWLHTGDLGYRDERGYLYLVDRRNDMIITGGENVYPSEVERVIDQLAGVNSAAVFGVPDERWGEAVSAVVVAHGGTTIREADVIAHCRSMLAGYKVPKRVKFAQELPRNPTGKILRRELRRTWPDI
jgi:acyl-CoA synthetase (AMP-forming)/AMP-acid ligase II